MRALFLFVLAGALFSTQAHAAEGKSYVSLFYGIIQAPKDFESEETLGGSTMGGTFGYNVDPKFALEMGVQKISVDKQSEAIIDGGGASSGTREISRSVTAISAGGRFFLLHYVNLHGGLGLGWTKLEDTNPSGTDAMSSPTSFLIYYGAGAQLPLGALDLYADLTYFSAIPVTRTIDFGLRVRF